MMPSNLLAKHLLIVLYAGAAVETMKKQGAGNASAARGPIKSAGWLCCRSWLRNAVCGQLLIQPPEQVTLCLKTRLKAGTCVSYQYLTRMHSTPLQSSWRMTPRLLSMSA